LVSLASEPELPKNTLLMPSGASRISRSARRIDGSVAIDEKAW
jgi:hypothetical protein